MPEPVRVWARLFVPHGRTRAIAPKFVTPYRLSGKNDAADAPAIWEAVQRPQMRFDPIKSEAQRHNGWFTAPGKGL